MESMDKEEGIKDLGATGDTLPTKDQQDDIKTNGTSDIGDNKKDNSEIDAVENGTEQNGTDNSKTDSKETETKEGGKDNSDAGSVENESEDVKKDNSDADSVQNGSEQITKDISETDSVENETEQISKDNSETDSIKETISEDNGQIAEESEATRSRHSNNQEIEKSDESDSVTEEPVESSQKGVDSEEEIAESDRQKSEEKIAKLSENNDKDGESLNEVEEKQKAQENVEMNRIINDENGNFQEISEDLLVVKQLPSEVEIEKDEEPVTDLDKQPENDKSEEGQVEDKESDNEKTSSVGDTVDELSEIESAENRKEEETFNETKTEPFLEERDKYIEGENQEDIEEEEEDKSEATDTSNLANIIVKHVLDSAVSAFNNDTSLSSDEGIEDQSVSKSSLLTRDSINETKHSDEQTIEDKSSELKLDLAQLKLEESSDQESETNQEIHFDENGNRQGERKPSFNPVAEQIAVAIVTDEKEAEKTRVTDQIRDDIKEISEHIKLNDTVETEQNMSRNVGSEEDKIDSVEREGSPKDNEEEASTQMDKGSSLLNRQGSEEGFQKLDPLPDYPDYPINYGNYKVCRNLSPRERECLILETGELLTCTSNERRDSDLVQDENKFVEEHEDVKNIFDRSSTPQQAISNSQPALSSPGRSGESSFRIMKNQYDLSRQSPITSPRDDVCVNNIPRNSGLAQQNGPDSMGYAHVNLSQTANVEDDVVGRASEDYRRQEEAQQRLNNEFESSRNQQSQRSPQRELYQTQGALDLSDPSVMVRYQRNLLSQNFQQNVSHDQQYPQERNRTQSLPTMSENDSTLLSQLYAKYGNSMDSRNLTGSYSLYSEEQVVTPPRSGPVPGYRTLHEQQNTWMQMFHTLEEKHQLDLQQQNRLHKEFLFNLQHQMEGELYDQQRNFQQKLNMHKEALSNSLNRSISPIIPEEPVRTGNRINDTQISRTTDDLTQSQEARDLSYQETFHTHNSLLRNRSPSWRDIYREIRGVDASSDDEPSPREPVRRSLDRDFTAPGRSRSEMESQGQRVSPRRSRSDLESEDQGSSPRRSRADMESQGQRSQFISKQPMSPREVARGSHDEPPRAGVYSSPMPILRGKINNVPEPEHQTLATPPRREDRNYNTCDRVMSPSMSEKKQAPSLQQMLEAQHRERLQQQAQRDHELTGDTSNSDDVQLSASMRVSLREKHAKHMADLREYYEKELRDLRSSLLADMADQSPLRKVSSENQNLVIENKLLREKIEDLEKEIRDLTRQTRDLKQINHGLEVRAKEYAESFNESQAKLSNFRTKMEELQFYYREKDETSQHLEYQVKHMNEKLRAAKKTNQELTEQNTRERGILQKISDKYDTAEREHQATKEALNSTENKLYDARTEIVELKRIISKLELENKRLSRENDNILHRRVNSSALQGSFHESFDAQVTGLSSPRNRAGSSDLPSPRNRGGNSDLPSPRNRGGNSDLASPRIRGGKSPSRETEKFNGSYSEQSSHSRSKSPHRSSINNFDQRNGTQLNTGVDDSSEISPVMRAEQDLYRLRDMMKEVNYSPSEPPKLKLQKKFYGSDIPNQSRNGEYSPVRPSSSRRRSPTNSPKPSTSSPKSTKSRRNARETSSNHVTNPKSQRPQSNLSVNPQEFSSPTRFDVSVDKNRTKPSRRQPQEVEPAVRNENEAPSRSTKVKKSRKVLNGNHDEQNNVENTINRIKSGEYVSRPEWEDLVTSMAKPSEPIKSKPRNDTIKERLSSISDLEHRYDDLSAEKRTLESALSRIPIHGKGRQEKERVEDKLDQVERELGSIRMSLKRYNVLKTSI